MKGGGSGSRCSKNITSWPNPNMFVCVCASGSMPSPIYLISFHSCLPVVHAAVGSYLIGETTGLGRFGLHLQLMFSTTILFSSQKCAIMLIIWNATASAYHTVCLKISINVIFRISWKSLKRRDLHSARLFASYDSPETTTLRMPTKLVALEFLSHMCTES